MSGALLAADASFGLVLEGGQDTVEESYQANHFAPEVTSRRAFR